MTAAGPAIKEYLHTLCSRPSANNNVFTAGDSEPQIKAVAESAAAAQLCTHRAGKVDQR